MVILINQTLSFLLELAMVVALGYSGFHLTDNPGWGYALMIGFPLAAILLWGRWAAPRSNHRLAQPGRMLFALALFACTSFVLYLTNHFLLAITLLMLATINQTLAFIFEH